MCAAQVLGIGFLSLRARARRQGALERHLGCDPNRGVLT